MTTSSLHSPCGARPRAAVTTHPTTTARCAVSGDSRARGGWVVIGRGRDLFGVCAAAAPKTRTHLTSPRGVCGTPQIVPGVSGAPQRGRRALVAGSVLSPATRGGSR